MSDSTLINSLNELNDYLDGKNVPIEIHNRTINLTSRYTSKDVKKLRKE